MIARHGRGQSLVEFSLVIPIFLLILVAVFDLGRGVFAYTSVTNAAREGVRFAAVNQDVALIKQRVVEQTFIAEADPTKIDVEFRSVFPDADFRSNARCTTLSLNCVAVLSYETHFEPITPLIARIVFPSGVDLQAQAVQALEYICPTSGVSADSCPKQP